MIFVNFKTYEQGIGADGLSLVKILESASHDSQIKIVPVLQTADIKEASMTTTLEVWAQHIDPEKPGAHTGATIPEAVKEDGAMGTFLNHSEHKFNSFERLKLAVERTSEVGLKMLVFAADLEELRKILKLELTFAAYEPPDLVGSKTTSVAEAKQDIIKEAVELARAARTPLVVGAGIKSEKDVRVSLELGAIGIAVASYIVKAKKPKQKTENLLAGFN